MPARIRSMQIDTKVGSLHVESCGRGPAVLCWPSLYCDARTLDVLVDDLGRDHQVVVIDGPGHGGSGPSPGACSLEHCADAAMQVLDAMGISRVTWIGAAWGGHIGVFAARRHPNRLAGLIVLNAPMAAWRGRRLALMRFTYALLWLFGSRGFVGRLIADKMIAPSADPDRRAMVDVIASALKRCDKAGLLRAAHAAMFERGDPVAALSEVHVPVVFVAGADDALFPVEEARGQAALIPECQFVVIERSAHQSALESPTRVLPLVRAAIRQWNAVCR
jgi:pimeloyl-ACP methyl ester carboxylesterase